MRLMDDYVREMESTLAVARWENSVGQRDALAERKREKSATEEGLVLTNKTAKALRTERLKELYRNEDAMYEMELTSKGLRFRKERI